METVKNDIHNDFNWTPFNLVLSIFLGVVATLAIWLFAGLLIGLFTI